MATDELSGILKMLQSLTGKEFDASFLNSRIRIQKSVYLLRALKYPLAKRYSFSDYFHGPYSPGLARDYYALREKGLLSSAGVDLTPSVVPTAIDQTIVVVAEAVKKGDRFLEAAAVLHSVSSRNPDLDLNELLSLASTMKPHLRGKFEEAWEFLTANRLVTERT